MAERTAHKVEQFVKLAAGAAGTNRDDKASQKEKTASEGQPEVEPESEPKKKKKKKSQQSIVTGLNTSITNLNTPITDQFVGPRLLFVEMRAIEDTDVSSTTNSLFERSETLSLFDLVDD